MYRPLIVRFASLGVIIGVLTTAAAAQDIRRLYAAEPPAGSTFVRIVNPGFTKATVAVASYPSAVVSAAAEITTPYVVVPGGKALTVNVDGKDIAVAEVPAAETFVTIVLDKKTDGYQVHSTVDAIDKSIGLNAELIFYNLVAGCGGKLALTDGSVVFENVASEGSGERAINPVAASLVASCGDAPAAPLVLPPLKSGDYYSIFLVGDARQPKVVGGLDQTTPYQDSGH